MKLVMPVSNYDKQQCNVHNNYDSYFLKAALVALLECSYKPHMQPEDREYAEFTIP